MAKDAKIDLRVTPEFKASLKDRAEVEGRSVAGLILFVVRSYMEAVGK